ncbi:MAG: thiamine phosphate synthase [Corynebacterium sp.]|nr:thiamine phosphate synthase [Corynebacterium sp.]
MRADLDLRCYFITGSGPDTVRAAVAAARGGAHLIQVRSKPISARDLYALAGRIASEVADAHVIIDDRVDVALALRQAGHHIHGVHLGQDDLNPRHARALLGPEAIIGLTTGTRELVVDSNKYADVIDYIGCGPFRTSPTKDSGRPPLGISGYEELVPLSNLPVVAIGDITVADVPDLVVAGVEEVAMVREIENAPDPTAVCQSVIRAFESESSGKL